VEYTFIIANPLTKEYKWKETYEKRGLEHFSGERNTSEGEISN